MCRVECCLHCSNGREHQLLPPSAQPPDTGSVAMISILQMRKLRLWITQRQNWMSNHRAWAVNCTSVLPTHCSVKTDRQQGPRPLSELRSGCCVAKEGPEGLQGPEGDADLASCICCVVWKRSGRGKEMVPMDTLSSGLHHVWEDGSLDVLGSRASHYPLFFLC